MAHAKPVQYDGKEYDVVREGLAEILNLRKEEAPQSSKKGKGGSSGTEAPVTQSVFYNPVQQFNRDLSVLAIKIFSEDISIARRSRHERKVQVKKKKEKHKRVNGGNSERTELESAANDRKRKRVDREDDESAELEAAARKKYKRNDGEESKPTGAATMVVETQTRDDFASSNNINTANHVQSARNVASSVEAHSPQAGSEQVANAHAQLPTTQSLSNETLSESTPEEKARFASEDRALIPEQASAIERAPDALEKSMLNCENGSQIQAEPLHGHNTNLQVRTDPSPSPPFRVLDALSATGLRAIRYAKEIPLVTSITANDLSPAAVASIALNVRHNELGDKIIPTTSEAQVHLSASASKPSSKYEVIDLDPYGTAVPFLDSAIQALVDGGLLCVTCTDASLFASMGYLEKTYTLYRGLPFKGQQSHEVGLRLILNAIATSAASYSIAIEPLLSISADFYVRLFVRVRRVASEAKFLGSKTMFLYYCGEGCGAFSVQPVVHTREKKDKIGQTIYRHTQALAPTATPTCEHCDYKLHLAGPMWGGPLHNPHFIQRILDALPTLDESTYATIPRIKGMLTLARDETLLPDNSIPPPTAEPPITTTRELPTLEPQPFPSLPPAFVDPTPLFIHPPSLCKALHCISPPDAALRGALLGLGYRVSRSHTKAGSVKTDAPWSVIWEVMREWTRQKAPVKEGVITKGTAGWGLMKRDRKHVKVATLKEEIEAVLRGKDDLEDIKDGLHAALYRATCGENLAIQERKDHATEAQDDEEHPSAASTQDPTTNGDVLFPGAKDKKPRERNSYKEGRDNQSPDRASQAKHQHRPTMTRPGHQPLSALQRSKLEVIFDERLGSELGVKGLVRYQMNPRENWGPMKKAKIGE